MNNKGVGAVFCLIAAILISARYLSAALFMSGVVSWDSSLFQAGLSYVGSPLQTLAVLALVVGIVFLVLGFLDDRKNARK